MEVSSRWQHPEAAAIENTDKTDKTEMADARYRGRHPEAGAPISAIYKECVPKVHPCSIAVIARRWFVRCSDGNWACVVRRRVGKGIQGACAPMAERRGRCGSSAEGAARRSRSTRRGSLTLALGLVQAARGLWLPSACPGRSADLCRATTRLVGRWGCCRWARALRCALRIASTGFGFHAALFLGFVLHSTLL